MKDIEDLLKDARKKDVNIPLKVEYRIQYALKNKNRVSKNTFSRKMVTILTSIMVIIIGSISVYGAFCGPLSDIPAIRWLGIIFSNKYTEYVTSIEGEEIKHGDTTIQLVSTMCDDGFTVLEFNVKLSKQDKEYLKIDENILTNENKVLDESDANLKNTICLIFNTEAENDKNDNIRYSYNNFDIILDNEHYWIRPRAKQLVSKISEYEYRVQQLYFLTDEELQGKSNFTLTLDKIVLGNLADYQENIKEINLANTAENMRYINLDGKFEINLSKEKALNNSNIINNIKEQVTYNNITKKIDTITITPLQIIAKVTTKINNVSSINLSNSQVDDFIGNGDYIVYDENGKELNSHKYEVKRIITYENGKTEKWGIGDIQSTSSFSNATMELTEYIIIEKIENDNSIQISPIIDGKLQQKITLDSFIIQLK